MEAQADKPVQIRKGPRPSTLPEQHHVPCISSESSPVHKSIEHRCEGHRGLAKHVRRCECAAVRQCARLSKKTLSVRRNSHTADFRERQYHRARCAARHSTPPHTLSSISTENHTLNHRQNWVLSAPGFGEKVFRWEEDYRGRLPPWQSEKPTSNDSQSRHPLKSGSGDPAQRLHNQTVLTRTLWIVVAAARAQISG